jgi:hypothetical protein
VVAATTEVTFELIKLAVSLATLKANHFMPWRGKFTCALSVVTHTFQTYNLCLHQTWCETLARLNAPEALGPVVAGARCTTGVGALALVCQSLLDQAGCCQALRGEARDPQKQIVAGVIHFKRMLWQLIKKSALDVVACLAVQHTGLRMAQIQPASCSGDGDVASNGVLLLIRRSHSSSFRAETSPLP